MGTSRVSSTLFDHKEQSAATKLQVVDHDGLKSSGKLLLYCLSYRMLSIYLSALQNYF
jgi:coiled-coil domain-containing protein 115